MTPRALLEQLLRPAGGGVYVVSTGSAEQRAMQEKLYGVHGEEAVKQRFREELDRISSAGVVVLGVPSDVGAGYLRGANMGPQGIRAAMLDQRGPWPDGVVDAGDVLVVPQLLHDEMLSPEQAAALAAGELDFALLLPPVSDTEPLEHLVVQRERFVAALPSSHRLAAGDHGDHLLLDLALEVVDLLVGKDDVLGGSWLAFTRDGRFAAVTNQREPGQPRAPRSRRSVDNRRRRSRRGSRRDRCRRATACRHARPSPAPRRTRA